MLIYGLKHAVAVVTKLTKPIVDHINSLGVRNTILIDDGRIILIINAMCNLFMPKNDFVFRSIEESLLNLELGKDYNAIFIDLQGEATSDKIAIDDYFDGKVSAIADTHTHVPTGDTRILDNGTAFRSDAGMSGDYNSIIGMDKAEPMRRFLKNQISGRFTPANGEATLCGVTVELNKNGTAKKIKAIRIGGVLGRSA